MSLVAIDLLLRESGTDIKTFLVEMHQNVLDQRTRINALEDGHNSLVKEISDIIDAINILKEQIGV